MRPRVEVGGALTFFRRFLEECCSGRCLGRGATGKIEKTHAKDKNEAGLFGQLLLLERASSLG